MTTIGNDFHNHYDTGRPTPVKYAVLPIHPWYRVKSMQNTTLVRLLGDMDFLAWTVLEHEDLDDWLRVTHNGLDMMMDSLDDRNDVDKQEMAYRFMTWNEPWFQELLHRFYEHHRELFYQHLGDYDTLFSYSYAGKRPDGIVVEVFWRNPWCSTSFTPPNPMAPSGRFTG